MDFHDNPYRHTLFHCDRHFHANGLRHGDFVSNALQHPLSNSEPDILPILFTNGYSFQFWNCVRDTFQYGLSYLITDTLTNTLSDPLTDFFTYSDSNVFQYSFQYPLSDDDSDTNEYSLTNANTNEHSITKPFTDTLNYSEPDTHTNAESDAEPNPV